jgi:hypothetical protein
MKEPNVSVNVVTGQVNNHFLYGQNMSKTLYGGVNIVNGLPQSIYN